jgi:hypothetical protein
MLSEALWRVMISTMFEGRLAIVRKRLGGFAVLGTLVLSLALTACTTTYRMRSVKTAGFLGDYSELHKGKKGEARLMYINPDADFSRYDAIEIDSVTLWHAGTSKLSPEDQQMLTDLFYHALHEALSKGFQIVDAPGPRVLRLRAALTEEDGANVPMNAVTSIVPQFRLLSTVLGRATATAPWVGKASAEVDITDSITNVRLAAGADRRSGTKTLRSGLKTWSDVKAIFEVWAAEIAKWLEEIRAPS